MKRKYQNNKSFKEMTITEKIVFIILVSTILIFMFFSLFGGIHALKHEFKKDNIAYAETLNDDLSVDLALPIIPVYSDWNISPDFFAFNTFSARWNFDGTFTVFADGDERTLSYGDDFTTMMPLEEAVEYGEVQFYISEPLTNSSYSVLRKIDILYVFGTPIAYDTNFVEIQLTFLTTGNSEFSQSLFLGFNSSDIYVPRDWDNQVVYSNTLNLSLDTTSENTRIQNAFDNGYSKGLDEGKQIASDKSYQKGLRDGLETAENSSFYDLVDGVFYGFGKFIYSLFSFDILGVNMYGFIITIISVGIVAFILRLVL